MGAAIPAAGRGRLAAEEPLDPDGERRDHGGADEDRRAQAGRPAAGGEADFTDPAAAVLPQSQSGDGAPALEGSRADDTQAESAQEAAAAGSPVRALHAESDVAERYHILPDSGQDGLHHRVHRRPLPLHHRAGSVSQPYQRLRGGDLPRGGGGVRRAQGNAHRQRAAVCQLARHDAVPEGTEEGSRPPHPQQSASSDDAGEDRAILAIAERRVPVAGAVRDVRGSTGTDRLLGEALQPPSPASGAGGHVPGGPVLRDPEGVAGDDRARRGGQRAGAGAAGPARGAVLPGGPDGRPERGDRDGQETDERAGGRQGHERRPAAGV